MSDNKYQRGKIYRLVCNTTGLQYYGSTCEEKLCKRLAHHKGDYKKYLNGKHNFMTSFKIIENNNYEIVLVELFPCDSKDELHKRERFYIENNKCINKIIPYRTKEETNALKIKYSKESEKMKIYRKNYYLENFDKINVKKKLYNENNKERLNIYRREYTLKNKDKKREYDKKRYEAIKQKKSA